VELDEACVSAGCAMIRGGGVAIAPVANKKLPASRIVLVPAGFLIVQVSFTATAGARAKAAPECRLNVAGSKSI
jgi:hypothetical protein